MNSFRSENQQYLRIKRSLKNSLKPVKFLNMFAGLIVSRKDTLFFAGLKGSQPLKIRARGFFLMRRNVKLAALRSHEGDRHWVQMQKISQGTSVRFVCSFDASGKVLFRVVFT